MAPGQLFKSPHPPQFLPRVFRRIVVSSCIVLGVCGTPYVQHLVQCLAHDSCFLKWQMLVILALIFIHGKYKWLYPLRKSFPAGCTNQGTKTSHHNMGILLPSSTFPKQQTLATTSAAWPIRVIVAKYLITKAWLDSEASMICICKNDVTLILCLFQTLDLNALRESHTSVAASLHLLS